MVTHQGCPQTPGGRGRAHQAFGGRFNMLTLKRDGITWLVWPDRLSRNWGMAYPPSAAPTL
jgi:hypothetical protein